MYVSFNREVPNNYYFKNKRIFKTNVNLESRDEMDNIYEFIDKYGLEKFKILFDIVGIEYISIENGGSAYKIANGTLLHLYNLSSGERLMIYALVMSYLNKPFIIMGLIDKLDKKHRDILTDFSDLLSTTIILIDDYSPMNRDIVNKFYMPFDELIKNGII